MVGMLVIGFRRTKYGFDFVTDELKDHAAMLSDHASISVK
jgi:hypothetical protein